MREEREGGGLKQEREKERMKIINPGSSINAVNRVLGALPVLPGGPFYR